ncbi:cyclopropane-fatty-acyl-phospholipid synthase [Candidatus Tenderia electrophaga]|jgi:cyclopropane-fatty-acyl-phospholipid synthase|uniref:Cyclopropane-fatty-acyl-phospholipid synthase n=1 Tax=Candidatus Tenderia electrophaga TaxID=1748243 RepID=A0A0S2TDV1_9GAMM|nr:cyclopropane-fatty-acyl-phospholipid synthase [Candidatus Tenderia electrophaga]
MKPEQHDQFTPNSSYTSGLNRVEIQAQDDKHTPPVSALERWLLRKVIREIGDPPLRIVLWDGKELFRTTPEPKTGVIIHDRSALRRLLSKPSLNFCESYCSGDIDVEGELLTFLEIFHQCRLTATADTGIYKRRLADLWGRSNANSLSGSRENIHHHYDIGNDFYRLWLDTEMQYTCAYFPAPDMSLEAAQAAKVDHVCRKLRLQPGETVVEAGCGWGGTALHMAKHYGVNVRAYNISHEQVELARQRAREAGLANQVEFVEDDYRNIQGEFDAFVSIGMLEHVGVEHYRELGDVINRALRPDGRGLIHSIGQTQSAPLNPWIEKRIFPGAYPPTLREMLGILEPWAFAVQDVENLRLHYSKTLEHWLARYEQHEAQVREMFDDEFVRAWRLYLVSSIAAFNTGALQLFQVMFTRPGNNDLPWSRAHLYADKT